MALDTPRDVAGAQAKRAIVLELLESKAMNSNRSRAALFGVLPSFVPCAGPGVASVKSEIEGAAIPDHACGKVAVGQTALVHSGKMEEAAKLATKEVQDQWKNVPASDRVMMSGTMREMSQDFRVGGSECPGSRRENGRCETLALRS